MGIQRNSSQPAGITNASGEPEIVLEIEGLTLSMTPPAREGTEAHSDDEEDPGRTRYR